jgi:hypothetical protein
MARRLTARKLAVVITLCLTQVCYAGQSVHALKINPFARPVDSQASPAQSVLSGEVASVPFVLRGTMVAGQQSQANISGVIVSLGGEINGYRLVAVHQREVVLLRDDERRILSVDDKKKAE